MAYNITSAATRGRINVTEGPTPGLDPGQWLGNRDNAYFNLPTVSVNQDEQGAIEVYWNEFGGNYTAGISRYFMSFSTLSVPTQITSATLYVYFSGNVDNNIMIVNANKPSTTVDISVADFKAIDGYNDGASMLVNTTNLIDYPLSPFGGWNGITLNANALNVFNGQPEVRLALVDYDYDYLYQSPPLNSSIYTGISISGTEPYLVVETGLGQYVISISPGATSKVNSVPQGNIKLVNRVSYYTSYRPSVSGCLDNPLNIPMYTLKPTNSVVVNDYVYTDPALTTVFQGGGAYWLVDSFVTSGPYSGVQWQIDNFGQITAFGQCMF